MKPVLARCLRSLQRNILAGIITIGPLFVTYLIFSFLLGSLAKAGLPVVLMFADIFPVVWLSDPWLQSVLAVLLTLAVLYVPAGSLLWWWGGRHSISSKPFWTACPLWPRSTARCANCWIP